MKITNTLPFISLLLIAAMIFAPFIFAQDAWDGDAWAVTDSSWSGNSWAATDWSWSGDAWAVNDNSWSGDASAVNDNSWSGDSNAVNDNSWSGSSGAGDSYTGGTGTTGSTPDTPSTPATTDFGEGPGGVPPGGPLPQPEPFPTNADAIWQHLPDVTLYQGASSGTILQKDVFSKCSDPDDKNLEFNIATKSNNFELAFFGRDLRIYNLKTSFTGKEAIVLECNKVPARFILSVIPRQITPVPAPSAGEDGDELSVLIGAIRLPEETTAGEQVPILISFKNNGNKKLEDVKAAVVIADLGVRASVGPFDLTKGKSISKTIYVELPQDVQPGTYTARITIDSGSLHRVKHRDVDVIA